MSARGTLLNHLVELQTLLGRCEKGTNVYERVGARVQECKDALKTIDKRS